MGEDTLQTEPDINAVKKPSRKWNFIVQDIFMTQTAAGSRYFITCDSLLEHEGVYSAAGPWFPTFL